MAEQNLSQSRKFIYTVLTLVLIAILAISGGYMIIKNGVSADTINNPPTPPEPTDNGNGNDIANPPLPPEPTDVGVKVPTGWSMVSGYQLKVIDPAKIRSAGVQIYSYNDPMFNARTWAVYPPQCTGDACATEFAKFDFRDPFAYYMYNANAPLVLAYDSVVSESKITAIGKGWHMMFWSRGEADASTLAENILVTYENGKTVSWKEANAESMHSVSNQVYVITTNSLTLKTAVKRLSSQDSDTEISKIPANSYFWAYARKTKSAIKKIEIKGSTFIADWEKAQIEAWLVKNRLNECGDPVGTIYAGGSCLFNEQTGKRMDKYEYLVSKYPSRPWLVLAVPISPTATASITATSNQGEPVLPPSPKL